MKGKTSIIHFDTVECSECLATSKHFLKIQWNKEPGHCHLAWGKKTECEWKMCCANLSQAV